MMAMNIAAILTAAASFIAAVTGLVVAIKAHSKATTAVNGTAAASHVQQLNSSAPHE